MSLRGLVLLSLLPALAQARDVAARLTVDADVGAELCPDERDLAARVEAILRRPLRAAGAASMLAIDVRFQRTPDGAFVARVISRGSKPGQRLLRDTDPTCSALGEAVGVAIALLLDSALKEAETTSLASDESPGLAPPRAGSSVGPGSSAAAPDLRAEPRSLRARAMLELGGSYGLGGDGSLVAFGRVGARHGSWLADVGAGGNLPTEQGFGGGTVETSLVLASLRACYLVGRSLALGPCLQLGAGRLQGVGAGYLLEERSSLPWTAAGGGLVLEAPLAVGLFASFGASLWVSTRRQTFSVQNAGIAWESKLVAGALTAGLGLTLF